MAAQVLAGRPAAAAWCTLKFEFAAMASPCEIALEGMDETAMRAAANAAIAEVHRIEAKYSRYQPQSVLSWINSHAGGKPVQVDGETAALLDFAAALYEESEGLFDITSGVLRKAWDFKNARVPTQAEIDALLPLVGWGRVEWQREARTIRLTKPGMELDFGGFGKEYACDRAAAVLREHGIAHALVNLGGDIHVLGPHAEGDAWQVAIQHPRPKGEDDVLATIPVLQGGVATSGDYERAFEKDGKRYCHILDPRTGWPCAQWQSITVIAANATSAGALTTIAMLRSDADEWMASQDACFLAVRGDGSMIARENEQSTRKYITGFA